MDIKIVFALLLCLFKYNDGLCRDRCLPYPVPFEVGCPTTCSRTSTCNPTSSCNPTSTCNPTSSCNPTCSSSWFRDVHSPCDTVDVVYFPEVQYPCGMQWDQPYYYGTCWCT